MHSYLIPGLELSPVIVQRLIARIPPDRLDQRIFPDRFTAREVAAHLADWEPIMRARIQAAAERPGSSVEAYDEGQMALDHGYAHSDPKEQAGILMRERRVTVDYVRGLSPQALKGSAFHPERGEQTVEDFMNIILGHDLYHLEQLSAYL